LQSKISVQQLNVAIHFFQIQRGASRVMKKFSLKKITTVAGLYILQMPLMHKQTFHNLVRVSTLGSLMVEQVVLQ